MKSSIRFSLAVVISLVITVFNLPVGVFAFGITKGVLVNALFLFASLTILLSTLMLPKGKPAKHLKPLFGIFNLVILLAIIFAAYAFSNNPFAHRLAIICILLATYNFIFLVSTKCWGSTFNFPAGKTLSIINLILFSFSFFYFFSLIKRDINQMDSETLSVTLIFHFIFIMNNLYAVTILKNVDALQKNNTSASSNK